MPQYQGTSSVVAFAVLHVLVRFVSRPAQVETHASYAQLELDET